MRSGGLGVDDDIGAGVGADEEAGEETGEDA